ncbi:UNVERIFIED_CONTAM: replication factor A protein 2 [Siphonaria sp. JEL0065]|nr:replication factor A protein 2 [Siphonaria sp. JEL0065]
MSAKRYSKQSLRPVSIKHLLRAKAEVEGANPMLDNEELSMVKIIGRVSKATAVSTFLKYSIADGPHSIECIKFMNDQSTDSNDVQTFSEGSYVKVIGNVKVNGKSNTLQVTNIFVFPVTSMDEVTYHNLECVYSYLQMTRGNDAMQTHGGNMTTDQSNAYNSSAYANTSNQHNFQQGGNAGNNQYAHLPRIEAQIMGLLDKYQDGVDVNTIMGTLRSVGSQDEIGGALGRLEGEGHVYDMGDGRFCKTG